MPEEGQIKSGTAFVVNNEGYLVTNEHVVSDCNTLGLVVNDKTYAAEVYSKNIELDIAIIKTSSNLTNTYIEFAPEVKTGQSITSLGYPLVFDLGTDLKVTNGIISSMSGYQGDESNFQFTAAIQPGNSGGPLVDEYNRLVGITTSALVGEEFQNVNFAIKSSVLQNYLAKNRVDFKISKSKEKIDIPSIVEKSKEHVRLIFCEVK